MITSIGSLIEGKLVKVNGNWAILPEDKPYIFVDEVLSRHENQNMRLTLTNLDFLEGLVKLGCQPGQETEFVEGLSTEQIKKWVQGE